ncbi:hypothetical protein GGR51DRAFT_69014 [Nemania sp. FL0031]|nr:hypothetical protein GGR51DRAFT_69014 [Nemania sp. FL0031]
MELCKKAKATKLLRVGKSEHPCENRLRKEEAADLEDACPSTCLTRPYKCNKCGSQRKQLTWRCSDCHGLRANNVLTWNKCQCPKHPCGETLLGAPLCKKCSEGCSPSGPTIKWICHVCKSISQLYAFGLECEKCLHQRCGTCKFLSP